MKPKGYCMNHLHVRYVYRDKQVLEVRSPYMVLNLYCLVFLRIINMQSRSDELLSYLPPTHQPNCDLVPTCRLNPRGNDIPVRN